MDTLVISVVYNELKAFGCVITLTFPTSFLKTGRILTQAIYALKGTALLPDVTSFH